MLRRLKGDSLTVRRSRRFSPGPIAAALLLLGYWLAAAVVIAVDPLDLYSWGVKPQIETRWQATRALELFSTAARDEQSNTIVVGSSTMMLYTPADIRKAFPDARKPWNISYGGARPIDRDALLRQLARSETPRHIILALDWSYVMDASIEQPGFSSYLYDKSWINDLRQVNGSNLKIIADWARSGQIIVGSDAPALTDDWAKRRAQSIEWHSAERTAEIRQVLESYRTTLAVTDLTRCSQLSTISDQLIPSLKALSAKNNRIDILFPPYSPLMYLPVGKTRNRVDALGPGFFFNHMLLRRCVVEMTSAIPNVFIWAPDKDLSLIADFDRYNDPGHLIDKRALWQTFTSIGDPNFRLTPDNVNAYIDSLKMFTLTYKFKGSSAGLPIESERRDTGAANENVSDGV